MSIYLPVYLPITKYGSYQGSFTLKNILDIFNNLKNFDLKATLHMVNCILHIYIAHYTLNITH